MTAFFTRYKSIFIMNHFSSGKTYPRSPTHPKTVQEILYVHETNPQKIDNFVNTIQNKGVIAKWQIYRLVRKSVNILSNTFFYK